MGPLSKTDTQTKNHFIKFTLQDIARVSKLPISTIYSDLKRGKFDKNDLGSVFNYLESKIQEVDNVTVL